MLCLGRCGEAGTDDPDGGGSFSAGDHQRSTYPTSQKRDVGHPRTLGPGLCCFRKEGAAGGGNFGFDFDGSSEVCRVVEAA